MGLPALKRYPYAPHATPTNRPPRPNMRPNCQEDGVWPCKPNQALRSPALTPKTEKMIPSRVPRLLVFIYFDNESG